MKTEQEEGKDREIRYQFWIRGLLTEGNEKKKFEELFRTYYKNVALFIFVYSINNKESLDCLDEAMETIAKEVPAEKLNTALLGTKCDLEEERQVRLIKKKVEKSNIFNSRVINDDEKKMNFRQLILEFHPDKTRHENQFATGIFYFLQNNKDRFLGVN